MPRHCRPVILLSFLASALVGQGARGQSDNPVYVDDSPQAWELFRQAQDQARDNAGEAVRLYQELLDEFGMKLIPVSEASPEHYEAVRQRVHEALQAEPALLDRYRLIQTPQAEVLLQNGELERLVATRSLTQPGIEALLRLGQRDLEAAKFQTARGWLNEAAMHIDLDTRRSAHCHFMLGLIGQYLDDPAAVADSLAMLAELGPEAEQFKVQLEQLAAQNERPAMNPPITVLQRGQASDLNDLVGQAIWSVSLEESLTRRRAAANEAEEAENDGIPRGGAEARGREINLTTAACTVVGEVVYVNQGHTILALHRLTGRQLWSYSDLGRLGSNENDRNDALDLSIISASGDSVVTLTGHAQAGRRSDGGKIVCLDAHNGSKRWEKNLNGVVEGAADEELFPHGAPLIVDGLVVVAARKVSPQLLTSAYVVALDLNSGDIRWTRHITSSGGLRLAPRPFCTLIHSDGELYVSSAVGATARLEPATGEIRWLRRFNVPISPLLADQGRRPWEIGGPVVTPRGLVALQPDQRRVVLLDRATGAQLESHSAGSSSDWNTPRYLLADDERVYAIGSEIRAFLLDNLETPLWRIPAPARESVDGKPLANAALESLELQGRVQLVEGALIVPSAEGVFVIDAENGAVHNKLAVERMGNPLAVESQLMLASGDRVDAYMSFSKAERMLRDRIAQAPSEPEPALSLLRLGMRVRNLPLALEAAELAMQSINRLGTADPTNRQAAATRGELFTLLLELAAAKMNGTVAEGESVYAMVGAVAADPQQRIEYLLAYGDWLREHALHRAVESYQSILSDPELAGSWRPDQGTMRPASAWAAQRLANLIEQRGASVYAPQADYASLRVQQTVAAAGATDPDPAMLIALAREFPFSEAAIEAALSAAAVHMNRGDARQALADLIAVHHAAPRRQTVIHLLGAFVRICEETGWRQQARSALTHIITAHGDLPLATGAGERRASAWLAMLDAPTAVETRTPRLGLTAGEVVHVEGSMVPLIAMPSGRRPGIMPAAYALLSRGDSLALVSAEAMQPVWTTPQSIEGSQLLRIDARGVLLWLAADPSDPKAILLDAATGVRRWTTPRLSDLVGDPVAELSRARGISEQMPDGEPFAPMQTIPVATDSSIIMIQRTGALAAIDLADGKTVLWSKKNVLEQVHLVAAHECALVLAGMSRDIERRTPSGASTSAGLVPRIVVLDPRTGQPLFEGASIDPPGRGGVKWMKISPLGVLVYGTAEGIDAIDLFTGRRAWSNVSYAALDSQRAWQLEGHLVVEDQRNRLRSISLRDGLVSEAFETPVRGGGEWEPLDLRDVLLVGDNIVAHYPRRVLVYEPSTGALAGADVISDEREYRWLLPFEDPEANSRMLLINSRSEQAVIGAQQGRNQYRYRLYLLSENGMVLADPQSIPPLGDKVGRVALIDGWVLLSTQNATVAVPMPTGAP